MKITKSASANSTCEKLNSCDIESACISNSLSDATKHIQEAINCLVMCTDTDKPDVVEDCIANLSVVLLELAC